MGENRPIPRKVIIKNDMIIEIFLREKEVAYKTSEPE